MFGCLRKIGCLALLVVGAGAAYLTKDRWMGRGPADVASDSSAIVWEPLTDEGATRAKKAVQSLSQRSGAVFANLRPGDLASYIFAELAKQLPPSAKDVRAAVIGDRLYVKALVSLKEIGGAKVLGPLAGLLSPSDTISLGGTFGIVKPGLAQFNVQEIKLREFSVPRPVLPKLVDQIRRKPVPAGISEVGLPLEIPSSIGDVRIARGRITLYKTVQ